MHSLIYGAVGALALAALADHLIRSSQAAPVGRYVTISPSDAESSVHRIQQLSGCIWYHESGRPCRQVWDRASGSHLERGCRCINPRDLPRRISGRVSPSGAVQVQRPPCPKDQFCLK